MASSSKGTRSFFPTAAHALHEPERQSPVHLDEQLPIHGALRIPDGERQQVLLERLERPTPKIDLGRQARSTANQLLIGRASNHAAQEPIGVDLSNVANSAGIHPGGPEPLREDACRQPRLTHSNEDRALVGTEGQVPDIRRFHHRCHTPPAAD